MTEKRQGEQILITFPDGNKKSYDLGITPLEIANSISKSLAKKTIAAVVNDKQIDTYIPLKNSANLRFITLDDEGIEVQEIIRHDAAHLMAQAVKELYPEVQVTIGPAIENGFYYDFVREIPFKMEDLQKIEKKMKQLAKQNIEVFREVWQRNEAKKFFLAAGETYKAEIIDSISEDQEITLYRQGSFIDLCRGPHARSTSFIKNFKLTKVSGAYWRGDSKNQMLQRIYGTAFAKKEQLDEYLYRIEEAEKRDHRKLGKELDLFHIQEEATGSVFWHHNGATLYRIIQEFIRKIQNENGYYEVKTPMLIDKLLWEKSGHWSKFQENMFVAQSEGRELALKPMNCPAHIQIYNQKITSYKDLPYRIAEFGSCHRNEPSGALHGLMRLRGFVQDDAHIFCTEEQITAETEKFSNLLLSAYKIFSFSKVKVKFSDRPTKRAGTDEVWDKAEQALRNAIDSVGIPYDLNPGEGAFYGPKLEFVLTDTIGRDWQCGTLQVDFVLPERLDAKYTDNNGTQQRPVMIHRAILGSFERFIGILIEHYGGKFPFWLAPNQVAITTVTNKVDQYAKTVAKHLDQAGIRYIKDISADKIGYKIRKYSNYKIPMIFILGEDEMNNNRVQIRKLGDNNQENLALSEINNRLKEISDIPSC
jgi:threonyl-tRNA synthetase